MNIKISGRTWIVAASVGICAVFFHPPWIHRARYDQLKCVINRHTGFAHMTRGMNENTIKALRHAVDDRDIPVLVQMLDDRDHVTQMTAARTLALMGDLGLQALRLQLAAMGQQTGANFYRFDAVKDALESPNSNSLETPMTNVDNDDLNDIYRINGTVVDKDKYSQFLMLLHDRSGGTCEKRPNGGRTSSVAFDKDRIRYDIIEDVSYTRDAIGNVKTAIHSHDIQKS